MSKFVQARLPSPMSEVLIIRTSRFPGDRDPIYAYEPPAFALVLRDGSSLYIDAMKDRTPMVGLIFFVDVPDT
jgi:hypothetical protein